MVEEKEFLFGDILKKINDFTENLMGEENYKKIKNMQMAEALHYAETGEQLYESSEKLDFHSSDKQFEKQWEILVEFLELHTVYESIRDSEFYFRRYPFRNKEVTKYNHFKYITEMFNYRIYEFKEKMKKLLTHIERYIKRGKLNIKEIDKGFEKRFKSILEARHYTTHKGNFRSLESDALWVTNLISHTGISSSKGWESVYNQAYRRETRRMAEKVNKVTKIIEEYLKSISDFMIENCDFLKDDIKNISYPT